VYEEDMFASGLLGYQGKEEANHNWSCTSVGAAKTF